MDKEKNPSGMRIKEFNQRLEHAVDQLLDNFTSLIGGLKIEKGILLSDYAQMLKERLDMQVRSENIERGCHRLLEITAELKEIMVFSDFEIVNQHMDERAVKLHKARQKTKRVMAELQNEIAGQLYDLEILYYNTMHDPATEE
eukprot:Nk52_evm12s1607 gene=Nk52_evmTU12s1607